MFRILIVKIGAIGDVVMALPMLTFLRKQYPDGEITWLCGKTVAPLLEQTGLINAVVSIDEKELLAGSLWQKGKKLLQLWVRWIGRSFDLVLTLHPDPRYRLLSGTVRAKQHRYLTHKWLVRSRYHAMEYIRLAAGTSHGPDEFSLEFPVIAATLNSQVAQQLDLQKKRIILAPGGAKNVLADDVQRRWPVECYAQVARHFCNLGCQVIITGAPSDAWVLPFLPSSGILNLVGQLSLVELIALYNQCALLITHDSGPFHLAKLTQCKVIGLFGPVNPVERTSPKETNITVVWGGEHLSCRPCYDGKSFAKCSNNQCLKSISVGRVIGLAEQALQISQRRLMHAEALDFDPPEPLRS